MFRTSLRLFRTLDPALAEWAALALLGRDVRICQHLATRLYVVRLMPKGNDHDPSA